MSLPPNLPERIWAWRSTFGRKWTPAEPDPESSSSSHAMLSRTGQLVEFAQPPRLTPYMRARLAHTAQVERRFADIFRNLKEPAQDPADMVEYAELLEYLLSLPTGASHEA